MKKTMQTVRRMITRLEKSVAMECGYEENIQRSITIRLDLEDFIKASLKAASEGKELP